MANERTYSCLPCADIDEAVAFYEALGFVPTYRQLRPNPYAVVAREDIHFHLFGMPGFVPANSYGNVLVVVPDPDALYHSFAEGLRRAYQKLPVAGIPRIVRPRKKFGTVRGFSVVDVGGNWLRISKLNDPEPEGPTDSSGLAKIIEVAARLGDAKGDDAQALHTLESGIKRHADAPIAERAKALIYRAELAVRVGNQALAESSLAAVREMELDDETRELIAEELAQTAEVVRDAKG